MAARGAHLAVPGHKNVTPGGAGGGQFVSTFVADTGSAWGQNRAPKPPTWVAKRGWRLAVLRGVAVAGEGQRLIFVVPRCTRAL